MGQELRYAVESKVQLSNSLACAVQREHKVQGEKKKEKTGSPSNPAVGPVAIQPMTRASATLRTIWPLRAHSKKTKHGVAESN